MWDTTPKLRGRGNISMPASCGKRLKATWAAVRIAEVLQQFYTQVLKKLESGKGRKSLHQHGIMAYWRSLSEKLS